MERNQNATPFSQLHTDLSLYLYPEKQLIASKPCRPHNDDIMSDAAPLPSCLVITKQSNANSPGGLLSL